MGMAEGIGKAAKMFGKGVYKATNAATYVPRKAAEGVAYGMEKTALGTFNALTKKEEKNFMNFYTGREISGLGKVVFPVAGLAIGVGVGVDKTSFGPKPGTVNYTGEPEIMAADGVSNAPTLGASGNMVFGLHNARRR